MFGSKNKIESAFNLNTRQADQALDKFKGKLGGLGALKGPAMAAGAIAAVGAAAATATVQMAKAAANFELQSNKIGTVFGEQIGTIDKWADSVRMSMGTSSHEVKLLAANFQDLLIPMGFTREAASGMTMDVVGLSAALSEWSGGKKTAAEVSDILAKAMLGEREQLKTLGISIMENDVVQRVATMGMKDATGAARQQARAIATQQLIFERSTDAQEAFADGTDSMFRTQQALASQISEMKNIFVSNLHEPMKELSIILQNDIMPILESFAHLMADKLPDAMRKTAQGIRDLNNLYKLMTLQGSELEKSEKIRASQMGMNVVKWYQKSSSIGVADMWQSKLTGFSVLDAFHDEVDKIVDPLLEAALEMEGLAEQAGKLAEVSALAKAEQQKYAQTIQVVSTHIGPIAQETIDMYATIHETAVETAEEIKAVAEQTLEGRKYFQKEMMLAQINGDTNRLDFLKKNQREILAQVKIQTAELAAAYEFSPELLQSIDIAGILTDHLWQAHLDGVKAALAEEERLKQERYSQAMKNASDSEKLALAIEESIRRGLREGTYDPSQERIIYRYVGMRGQLQRWYQGDEGQRGMWGALAGGTTDAPIQTRHSGGMVSGPVGSEQRVRALGGETVLPIGAKAGAVTINFNGLVAGDPVAIGQEIARIVNKSSQSNGAIINGSAVTS